MIKKYLGEIAARFVRDATQHHTRYLKEIAAFDILQFNLQRTGYDSLLFPGGYAANATLLLELFRMLELTRPDAILECGCGESTGLFAHYARRNPGSTVVTLEDQPDWSAMVEKRFRHPENSANFQIITAPLLAIRDADGMERRWYKSASVDSALKSRRFNLILVDGPSGRSGAGRSGILSYFPRLLDEQFALFFDDAGSSLYSSDIAALTEAFHAFGRPFVRKDIVGEKRMAVFASPELRDLIGGQTV
jgi:hypothetical protein